MNRDITFYAFRYCLGRRTYAVHTMVEYLLDHWEELGENTTNQMKREILEYRREIGLVGMEMDDNQWQRILDK